MKKRQKTEDEYRAMAMLLECVYSPDYHVLWGWIGVDAYVDPDTMEPVGYNTLSSRREYYRRQR